MFIEWLKEVFDRDYRPVQKWKAEAKSKQQRLVLIWNSPERCIYPIFIPSHVTNLFEYVLERIRGKQEYYTDFFDYREKKVESASSMG